MHFLKRSFRNSVKQNAFRIAGKTRRNKERKKERKREKGGFSQNIFFKELNRKTIVK